MYLIWEVNNQNKCFQCKKIVGATDPSAINFFSMHPSDQSDEEYIFCSDKCLDSFFRSRIEFYKIVKDFDK